MKPFPTHIYTGRSMAPLFRPGDGLRIESVTFDQVNPGDVIVFHPPQDAGPGADETASRVPSRPGPAAALWPPSASEGSRRVVHRVMTLRSEGFITRGDANPSPDEGFVAPDRLEGRVVALERGGTTRHVFGGRIGLLRAGLVRLGQRIGRPARRAASAPYSLLRCSRILRCFWHPHMHILKLSTLQGTLVKYLHGNRTVARWWPDSGRFECRKPYDLILDPPRRPTSKLSPPATETEGGGQEEGARP